MVRTDFVTKNIRKNLIGEYERQHGKNYLMKVTNPKGKKANAVIGETLDGWTARYSKKPYRFITFVKKNPEKLAKVLASKGHKSVEIWD